MITKKEKIRVGIIINNQKNEILLISKNNEKNNKKVYNIPFVEIEVFDEKKIIEAINDKYRLIIEKLDLYIDEIYYLDDECNNILQVNFSSTIDENGKYKNMEWKNLEIAKSIVGEKLLQTFEIYEYNSNVSKR